MLKRICPVCEQVMKGRHYCPACRSFVKHPKFVEADYYLNERHPSFEKDCDYHNPSYERMPEKSKNDAELMRQRGGGTRGGGTPPQKTSISAAGRYINGDKKQNPAASAIVILTVIVIMISLLAVMIPFTTLFFF